MKKKIQVSALIIFMAIVSNAQTVTVNFAQPDTVNNMLGFIHGMSSTQPVDSSVLKLHPSYWRGGTLTSEIYTRATSTFGTKYILVTSDFYGYPVNNPNWIPPFSDTIHYNNFIDSLCTLTSGLNVIYEPWNEPDGIDYWAGTDTLFFQTFVSAEHRIRQNLGNNVEVIGPSTAVIDTAYIRNFCNYCLANNVRLDYLSWHWFFNDVYVYLIEDALNWATTEFVNNPAYAALQLKGIIIGEMTSSTQHYQPAHYLANLYYMEKGKAVGAVHACWDAADGSGTSECWNNTLDGLLTTTTKQPRATWWAAKCYSETVDERVESVSSSSEIISFAATNPYYTSEANVLIAHYARSGFTSTLNVTAQINNLASAGFIAIGDSVKIKVYKIPNDSVSALTSLPIIGQQTYLYTGQDIAFPLPALSIREAYWLSITKGNVPTSIDGTVSLINTPNIYPNPTSRDVTIQFPMQNFDLAIYDCLGRKTYTLENITNKITIDCSNFSSGIYYFQTIANKNTFYQKIIKE